MKTILITGGSGGIGRETVFDLLHEGYAVINLDVKAFNVNHEHYTQHSVNIGHLEELELVLKKLPSVHGIINNAVLSNNGPFLSQPMDKLQDALDVNVIAAVRLSQWFANQFKGSQGRIINISSTRAKMSETDTIPYSVSKGALEALTHSLAITLANKHITVNAIAPGWIHHSGPEPGRIDHAFHPSGRIGRPSDISRMILFLLEEDSQFINGQVLTVDGGVTKKMIYPD